jgi:hypothetical protein
MKMLISTLFLVLPTELVGIFLAAGVHYPDLQLHISQNGYLAGRE